MTTPVRRSMREAARLRRGLRAALLATSALVVLFAALPGVALAEGPNAVMRPAGYDAIAITRGDDNFVQTVNLPFTMNWFGTSYTKVYIQQNGNVTFNNSFTPQYNPSVPLSATGRDIMAPFWADVDTGTNANPNAAASTYSTNLLVDGHKAVFINWIDVGYYNHMSDKLNSFQIVLIDRSDTGAGNFDFMFNYDKVQWDIGSASSTYKARAGWARNGGASSFELPGSGVTAASTSTLLDSSASGTSLIQNTMSPDNQLGRYMWQVRNGGAPNMPPKLTVTDRTLEGNSNTPSPGYAGYAGTGDAVATDSDGSIASLTNNRPAYLPLGTTTVLWTATDNQGSVTTETQTIVVRDTTPPTNPTLSSPTHTTGVWSWNNAVRVLSSGATDTCSGVDGFSYDWSRNSADTPDTVQDPLTTTVVTGTTTTTVDSETFPTATWPADWTRSSTTYIRLTNAAGRFHDSYAAELYSTNNTRRTFDFYKDYDLSSYTSATVDFWDQVSTLAGGTDYARVEYSTNGGTSYTQLQNLTAASAWTHRTYNLPVGGTVRVRFSGSVNAATEYADWDDITVTGYTTTTTTLLQTDTTNTLADGTWYFNLRTVDDAGNWTAPVSMGPFLIDTVPPVTTDNVPSAWQTANFPVTLTATDAGVVAYTKYKVNGSALTTYTGTFTVSTEGTNTIQYWSADAAGHVEATKTVTLRLDTSAPTSPSQIHAASVSTTSVEVTWTASTDAVSGIAQYGIYRDGSLVATTTSLIYTVTGLNPGQTYSFQVRAFDVAGNYASTTTVVESTPATEMWLDISSTNVAFGDVDPDLPSFISSAEVVTVSGVGLVGYDLSVSGIDFTNTTPGSFTPTMPIGMMSYTTRGWKTAASKSFTSSEAPIDSVVGVKYVWHHPYIFDYTLILPWVYSPGDYTTNVTYTAIEQ